MIQKGFFSIFFTSIIFLTCISTQAVSHETQNDWFRHAAISPDGETVLFSYKGDVYSVNSKGGTAIPLTMHSAWEGYPVWSKDGKSIAFASDRNGNLDIFVMSEKGGQAKRLTYHSRNDIPSDFSPDGNYVLFSSSRMDSVTSSYFPSNRLNELYEVSILGGTPRMVTTVPATEARYNSDGSQIAYREEKAYESDLRKHDTSSFARDTWIFDVKTGAHKQITTFKGGDHTPIWNGDSNLFYLSEEGSSTFNVWSIDLNNGEKQQLSNFKLHPVRSLSLASNGTLAYTHHGSIYTHSGQSQKRLEIKFLADDRDNDSIMMPVSSQITEFAVSPNGKEVAFIAHGEVFATSTDFKTTKRITNTAERERGLSFHKDGRTLLYASSRNGKWKLFESSLGDESEKYFFTATVLKEELLHESETESFQPEYSPDGKKVAFLAGRDEIQVINRENKKINIALGKKHNYSYADGDINFSWSPDSKWLVADFAPRGRLFITNIGIFPADGSSEPIDISHSGYQDGVPRWGRNGDVVYWNSTRFGMRSHGSWGRQFDVMASFLTQDAYDKFKMNKEEYELMKEFQKDKEKKEKEEKDNKEESKKSKSKKKDKEGKDSEKKEEKPLKIEWENLDDRMVRLTHHSSNLGDGVLSKDSSKLYYLARFEKGFDLWEQDFKEGTTKLVKKLGARNASIVLSEDDEHIFILADGKMSKSPTKKISPKPIADTAVMELKPAAERAHMFEHAWRKIKDKFYNPDMHGVDWDLMKLHYQDKLTSINNNRDLGRMMEEMMGELNASHTGTYYRQPQTSSSDNTAGLGLILDMSQTSGGLIIEEVLDKSPIKKEKSDIKKGMTLVAIDGVMLDGKTNLAALLNHKAGERVRLTIKRSNGQTFEEVTKPISLNQEANLIYERWAKTRRALVDKLSGGRIGYVHVQGMDDASFRVAYSEILGRNFDKEGLIVDTRWNGGGWLHNDLAKLLSGKNYLNLKVRGRTYSGEPMDQWYKPSLVVMNEGNYSDAHTFPYTYKTLKIGDTVGMPVPGTSTSVWWEQLLSGDLTFGVPQVGNLNMKGEFLENKQVEPDYKVKNDPQSSSEFEDKQIEKAVEVMLGTLTNK